MKANILLVFFFASLSCYDLLLNLRISIFFLTVLTITLAVSPYLSYSSLHYIVCLLNSFYLPNCQSIMSWKIKVCHVIYAFSTLLPYTSSHYIVCLQTNNVSYVSYKYIWKRNIDICSVIYAVYVLHLFVFCCFFFLFFFWGGVLFLSFLHIAFDTHQCKDLINRVDAPCNNCVSEHFSAVKII